MFKPFFAAVIFCRSLPSDSVSSMGTAEKRLRLLSSLYREARLDPLSRRSHVTKTGYQRENEVQEPAAGSGMASGGDAWFPVSSIPKTWSESPFKDTVFHFALCVRKKRFRDFSHAPRPQKSPPIPHRSRFFSLFTCKFRKMPINAMSERYEPD